MYERVKKHYPSNNFRREKVLGCP
ncbi:MAG: hypothetical protein ACLS5K_02775 [Streptococcus salivarius]